MVKKISQFLTEYFTGSEEISRFVLIGLSICALLVSGYLMFIRGEVEVYIAPVDQQTPWPEI